MRNQESKGPKLKVNFVILKSPHERHDNQLIVRRQYLPFLADSCYSRGVTEEINNSTTASEIIWRFSRYPRNYPERITPKQNPHFYLGLSNDAASYDSRFKKGPLKDFAYRLHPEDTIYVLLDKSCRLFLDAAPPHIPRIFGNLWKPHRTVILKGEHSPRCVVCSNPSSFKTLSEIWNQKIMSFAELGRAKTTGIALPEPPTLLWAASNRDTQILMER